MAKEKSWPRPLYLNTKTLVTGNLEMHLQCDRSGKLAVFFQKERFRIASRFAEISTAIPRWKDSYQRAKIASRLDNHIAQEFLVFPQYLEKAFISGDSLWLNLYVGEIKKLGYAADGNFEIAHTQINEVLERQIAYLKDAIERADLAGELATLSGALDQIRAVISTRDRRVLDILWIADCLYLDIQSFLAADLASEGLDLRPDLVTTKNPVERYEQTSRLLQSRTYDAVFYCPFSYENNAAYTRLLNSRQALSNTFSASQLAHEEYPTIEVMLRLLSGSTESPVIVHNASGVSRHIGGMKDTVKDVLTRKARISFCRTINPLLDDLVGRLNLEQVTNRVIVLDEFSIARTNGLRNAGSYFHAYGQQHPARLGLLLKDAYLDTLWTIQNLQKKKVVVCDLDNTLWNGVIGEGAVDHYHDRQTVLKSLKENGVLLAANSKNNPANVTWKGAVLSDDDFACLRINWQTKAENIGEIADEMNLSCNSFVFIDDRADERAIAASVYPEIVALDADDPAIWRRLALWARMLRSSAEMDRTKMYRERQKREAFVVSSPKHSSADLFAQLDLKCIVSRSESKNLLRITELINRTNQFNTTGRKTTIKEVSSWHEEPNWSIYTASASDRFGDMGLVGVLVARETGNQVEIEIFVLSCRVFGYGIETAILAALTEANASEIISGVVMPTAVNQPCLSVYADHHFHLDGDRHVYDHNSPRIINRQWLRIDNRCPLSASNIHSLPRQEAAISNTA